MVRRLTAACAETPVTSLKSTLVPHDNSGGDTSQYKSLYSFSGYADGAKPMGDLIAVHGILYGTTLGGGVGMCQGSRYGCGTVYEVDKSGKERVLYSFKGGKDGPQAGLVYMNGELYGTTFYGGAGHCHYGSGFIGCGTVFEVSLTGVEHVVHSFTGSPDGSLPRSELLVADDKLYGTTEGGGTSTQCTSTPVVGCGTLFQMQGNGKERVLYRFKGNPDAAVPLGRLTMVKGAIYGITVEGGNACPVNWGCGTVFEFSAAHKESLLHSFAGSGYDGVYPTDGVSYKNGIFYGTSGQGGTERNAAGTVYQLTTTGSFQLIYVFGEPPDAGDPQGLAREGTTLYGTAYDGGSAGAGAVFAITAPSQDVVLYNFEGSPDGAKPESGLLNVNGKLYGTTTAGGTHSQGTVFEINP